MDVGCLWSELAVGQFRPVSVYPTIALKQTSFVTAPKFEALSGVLADHIVRSELDGIRNCEAQGLRCLQVDT